jgi:hypothetical protein
MSFDGDNKERKRCLLIEVVGDRFLNFLVEPKASTRYVHKMYGAWACAWLNEDPVKKTEDMSLSARAFLEFVQGGLHVICSCRIQH